MFFLTGFAHCENESSEYFRQDLVTLTPNESQYILSENDSKLITCKGTDIKWMNPWGKYVTNLKGRVRVVDGSNPNDEVHVLMLFFYKIEQKDFGNWTCEGTYGKKSFEMIIYEPISFKNYDKEVVVAEDNSAIIPCAASGSPKPHLYYYHNNSPIEESIHFKKVQDGLWIDRVTLNMTGNITCKAVLNTSQIINTLEQSIHLEVQCEIL